MEGYLTKFNEKIREVCESLDIPPQPDSTSYLKMLEYKLTEYQQILNWRDKKQIKFIEKAITEEKKFRCSEENIIKEKNLIQEKREKLLKREFNGPIGRKDNFRSHLKKNVMKNATQNQENRENLDLEGYFRE